MDKIPKYPPFSQTTAKNTDYCYDYPSLTPHHLKWFFYYKPNAQKHKSLWCWANSNVPSLASLCLIPTMTQEGRWLLTALAEKQKLTLSLSSKESLKYF